MSIIFGKIQKKNPINSDKSGLYYPQLFTLGRSLTEEDLIFRIKEKSSLTKGDIQSVVTNLIEETRMALYDGFSVNLRDFGVFALSAKGEGAPTEEKCTANNIKSVRITFRASSSVRPNMSSTRAGDRLKFVDLQTYLKGLVSLGASAGPGDSGNDDGDDPTA